MASLKDLFNVPATRAFGAEIEFQLNNHRVCTYVNRINAAGVEIAEEGYNHYTRPAWKIITDGSIGATGREIVSPILSGESGRNSLFTVGRILNEVGGSVNSACGFHVHVDARDLDLDAVKRVCIMYLKFESAFDLIQPASRRNSRWCKSNITTLSHGMGGVPAAIAKIKSATSITELRHAMQADRYHKLNLESLTRHGTIEFRQHSGTICPTKMTMWAELVVRFVEIAAKAKHIAFHQESKLENLLAMYPTGMRKFYRDRARSFASTTAE